MESGEQKAGGYLGAGGVAFCGKVVEGIVGFTSFDEGSRGIWKICAIVSRNCNELLSFPLVNIRPIWVIQAISPLAV